ncbi:uricase [Amanita muscaria]
MSTDTHNNASYLSHAQYGKTSVRVFRVVRDGAWHHVVEYNVTVLVEGNIETSYTQADNSVVIATDSMKNITYYLAKVSPHILSAEKFAIHLGSHIVFKYAHLHKAFVTIEQLRWTRIPVEGIEGSKGDPHSFLRDGDEKRVVTVEVDATNGKNRLTAQVSAGLTGLLVLKSTGSAFSGFIRDEYTTLAEVEDRILSTAVDLTYTFRPVAIPAPRDEAKLVFDVPEAKKGSLWDEKVGERVRKATLEIFAKDESASVQATLYKMGERVIAENAEVDTITYTLPNKHYVPVDMKYIGVDNTTPSKAEVFMPIAHPSGQISATISRK